MAVGPLPGAYLSTETNVVPIRGVTGVMRKEFDTGQTDRQTDRQTHTHTHTELKRRGPPGPGASAHATSSKNKLLLSLTA